MANFPPKFDARELWLPSDSTVPDDFSIIDDLLARRLAAMAFLNTTRSATEPSAYNTHTNMEWVRPPPVPCGSRNIASQSLRRYLEINCCTCTHTSFSENRNGPYLGRSELSKHISSLSKDIKPAHPKKLEVDRFVELRARVLQKQQQQFNRIENRFIPFEENIGGVGTGRRTGEGTGVFHPRTSISTTPRSTTINNDVMVRKKKHEGVRNMEQEVKVMMSTGDDDQGKKKNKSMKTGKRGVEECSHNNLQLSPEVCLPRDWVY